MEITEWTQDLNIGIEVIDSQHRRIVDYINDLTHAIIAEDQAEVADVLERLRDYTFDHFAFEEQLMQKAGYELLEAHQAVHRRFEEKVVRMQEELQSGREPFGIARRVRTALLAWLIQHIRHEDVDYVPLVKKSLKSNESWIESTLTRIFGSSSATS